MTRARPKADADADCQTGLQTPRLKRLAEIVSAQAMAQQEKLEFEEVHTNGNGEVQGLAISEVDGM